ncbi:MAG: FecR domain-containing protein [Saprospirales bacterium]|nr:FecR domain-containing protein [Saprospirales bacterium]
MDLSTQHHHDRIAKYLSGNMSPEEGVRFEAWLEEDPANQQLLKEALGVWQAGEEETFPDFDKDVDDAWKKVVPHIQRPNSGTTTRMVRFSLSRWAAGIAASVAILAMATWVWFNFQPSEVESFVFATGIGERQAVLLPDSSTVWLNERSKLSYTGDFSVRSLQLEGEAFFEVRRMEESPFRVESMGTTTEVLGTSFNIRAYPEESEVELTVETGKVAFAREDAPEQRLEVVAGSSAVFKQEEQVLAETAEKIDNALAWRTGRLEFDDATLGMVRMSFERFYGIHLEATDPAIWNCHFTGTFEGVTPAEAAETLAFTQNLELLKADSVYTLSGSGCDSQ